MILLPPPPVRALPAIVALADDQTQTCFLEFFAVTIGAACGRIAKAHYFARLRGAPCV